MSVLGVDPSGLRPARALALSCAGLLAGTAAHATSFGPQAATSGVPEGGGFAAEQTCVACHASQPLNPDGAGRVELRGLPARYAPGARYTLTFAISHPDPSRERWGFQLTAVAARTLRAAGDLIVTDARNTQLVRGGEARRQYLEHTAEGTGIGRAGGHSWTFDWIAPARDEGPVAFYGGGSAANLDGSKTGDWIYSPHPEPLALVPGPEAAPAVEDASHGPGREQAADPRLLREGE